MRLLLFLLILISTLSVSGQDICYSFVPTEYNGQKAPDIRIEIIEHENKYLMAVYPFKKGNPCEFNAGVVIDVMMKHESEITLPVNNMQKIPFEDETSGKTYFVYLYELTRFEMLQVKLGIIGIIYVEPFPGEIIGYRPLGGC